MEYWAMETWPGTSGPRRPVPWYAVEALDVSFVRGTGASESGCSWS